MKKAFIFLLVMAGTFMTHAQSCSSCGKLNRGGSAGKDIGPNFRVSLGTAQYGESAGHLVFSSSLPNSMLFTPAALQYTAPLRTDVTVITTNLPATNFIPYTSIFADVVITTNISYVTNSIYDDTGTNLLLSVIVTNTSFDQETIVTTNTTVPIIITNTVVRQVWAPQVLADIPIPPTSNGYVINFYYTSQVGSVNPDGTYAVSGTPCMTWVVTNPSPATINQLQISQIGNFPSYGLMKQWTYAYNTNAGTWSVTDLGGVQESMTVTNINSTAYQVVDTVQYSNGPVVQQTAITYTNFSVGDVPMTLPFEVDAGSSSTPQKITYSYNSSGLQQTVTHPDGSWEYYASYDLNGNPTVVYSSFEDAAVNSTSARETDYAYGAGYGDDGTINPRSPRQVIGKIQGVETSRKFTLYPSVGERLDIQCTVTGAAWNASGNLVTTNYFYTSGPNQFSLQSVIRPDGTMTAYNYFTNGIYKTNLTVTGQPDSSFSYIVDGVSNVTVLNSAGYNFSANSYDVLSGLLVSQDMYGDFDTNGRPQQVAHLDGTTEYTQYACCGLESTTDRDGLNKVYLYDSSERQVGYEAFYQGTSLNPITFLNVFDAAGRTLQSYRYGSDSSSVLMSQSAYDLAGELVAQTNSLNGVITHSWFNAATGGFVRTTTNPDSGTVTNYYYADGSLKQVSGTGVHGVGYQYGTGTDVNGNTCTYTEEIKLKNDGTVSSETTTTYSDMAGRTTEILYADGHYSQSFYNSQGQLWKQIDPDGVTTQYQYNAKGEQAFTVVDPSGADRITQTTNDVTTDHGTTVSRSRNYEWLDGASSGTLASYIETSANGLNVWRTQYRDTSTPVTTHSQIVPGVSRTETTTAPDGSYAVSAYSYGRMASSTRYDSGTNQIAAISYGYDAQGHRSTMTDARNGTTTLGFNNADLVVTNTTPNPGGGSPEVNITSYNTMLQPYSVTQPDGTTISSVYLLTGELEMQYGSRTYPVGYSYDYSGRMQTMTNWSNFGGLSGARQTMWNYDPYRGWLTSKVYADGHGPSYSYTPAGRLASRAWVRGVTTSYAYNTAGSLTNISYSDSTPWVTNSYDRLGRLSSVLCNGMADTFTYNLANELLGESFSGGTLAGLALTNAYDADLRRTTLSALASGSPPSTTTYGYDNASRLSSVNDGSGNSATYSYLANSPLVSQITFLQSSTTRMTMTKQYDYLNRLTQMSSAPSTSYTLPLTFNYNYNPANQRTKDTLADGSYWVYGYDSLGQVTNACKFFADGTPVAGQQFDYTFDTIGNRLQTLTGGDSTGANLRVANYTNNTLNQIISRDVPAYVDVMGASILTNTVTVNGQTAYRKEEYYRQQLAANNTNSALWTNIIVAGGINVTGNVYVAREPEQFGYDADGNLTNDGRWAYVWDGENRLKSMTVNTNVGPQYQLTFGYDFKGRRIQKLVSTNSVAIYTNRFLYDGWNLIAEVQPNNSLIRSYMWGADLSGSMQGAGGVGGLLEVSYYGSSTTNCFLAYDGNGNVAALINAADGTTVASYEYAAFGEPIRVTGVMAKNNPFRFSTKYDDDESDMLYYGYRYYKPSTGTWPNRDPLGDEAFLKFFSQGKTRFQQQQLRFESLGPAYLFIGNTPLNAADGFGLKKVKTGVKWCEEPGFTGHEWLEYPGGSAGFYPAGNVWWGAGQVENPDPHDSDADKKCADIELDDCAYDIQKFVNCVKQKSAAGKNGQIYSFCVHNCGSWVGGSIRACEDAAKK